jgi:hypothetical protein
VSASLLVLLGASSAGAAGGASTFTVTGFGDGSGSCGAVDANGNSACTTLRAAVTQANLQSNTPTIELQAGTFQLTSGQLGLGEAMNIVGAGPGGPNGTTIQQTDGQHRVFEVDGSTTFSGLEITGGHLAPSWSSGTTEEGGGILAEGPLVLRDVLVTGNEVQAPAGPGNTDAGDNAEGGGIAYAVGTGAGSAITDSTISANNALAGAGGPSSGGGGNAFGGGIAYEGDGPLAVQDSTVSGNAAGAGQGGGAVSTGGTGGFAEGGGIWHSSALTLAASTVVGNSATGGRGGPGSGPSSGGDAEGGGVADIEALAQVVNATVFSNLAQGGAGNAGGATGGAYGGGIYATGSDAGAALQSDTIDGNQAASDASNLYLYLGDPPNPYTFTLHDTMVAGGQPASVASCDLHGSTNPPSSESYNLEDDSADSCGFNSANHDLVGANPELPSSLANNGGPTQTLAPAPGSPVLGAGGQCTDPTSTPPGGPLTVDQRGEPRATPCDIGAFQAQRPLNMVRPTLTGTATRGHTLICNQGAWTGDGSLQYSFAWLRNGTPIQGATTNSYVIGKQDPGQSLACRVTATYYGSVAATSKFAVVTSYPLIMLLRARTSHGIVVVDLGCRGVDGQRCSGRMQLTVVEELHGSRVVAVAAATNTKRRTVTVAQHSYSLLARHTATIKIALKANAAQLLRRFRRLPLLLKLTQTTALRTATVASRKLKFRPAPGRA